MCGFHYEYHIDFEIIWYRYLSMTICVLIGRHKHMCRKITTFTFGDIASVSIARFECTKDRILNILNLFEYKNAVIEIGCIEKTSALF